MKRLPIRQLFFFTGLLSATFWLTGCETVIPVTLDSGPVQLAVEATVYNSPVKQSIRLTQTAPYFSNAPTPVATGATVTLANGAGRTFQFTDPDNDGNYDWTPASKRDSVGAIGQQFTLTINYQNETYQATSALNRVPPIDSLVFRDANINPLSKKRGYRAEFFMTDIPGPIPDYYRIEFARNGLWETQTTKITTVYNGSIFGGNSDSDGLLLVRPGRVSINPDSLYNLNEDVTVRLTSISAENYYFLRELRTQLNNTGLFATPATNVPTNIVNTKAGGKTAVGFFVMSVARTMTRRVAVPYLRPKND